jgi:hypothetical protein
MAINGISGNGATLTLSGFTMAIRTLNLNEESRQDVNFSHLGDTSELYKPGDTFERGSLEFEAVMNPKLTMPAFAAAASITVTLPKMDSASSAAATLIGTGYVNMRKYPDLANNTAAIVRGRIKWDGDTDPAFTVEA